MSNGLSMLGQVLGDLGSKLEKVYGTRYGQEEASRDLNQLQDASGQINIASLQQKLNTGSPFSSSGQAYNQAMEQAGLGVATTNWNVALTNITQQQLANPNFDPKTATQDFTKLGLQAMNNTLQNVDPSIRSQLQTNMVNSLNQNMRFLADKSIKIDTQNQRLSVLNSIDQDNKLVSTYLERGDAKSALGVVSNQNDKLNLLVNTGAMTASEAVRQRQDMAVSALSQIGISQGLDTAKAMNEQLPDNYKLSPEDMKQVSLNMQQDWMRKQEATEISNFENHSNYSLYLYKLASGDLNAQFSGEISDKMSAEIALAKYKGLEYNEKSARVNKMERDYRMAGQVADEVGRLTPSEKWAFTYNDPKNLSGNALDLYNQYWKDLPVDAQKVAMKAINDKQALIQVDTRNALNIESTATGTEILSTMRSAGVEPKNYINGIDPDDVSAYINTATSNNPANLAVLNQKMVDKYKNMSPLFYAKVQQQGGDMANGLEFSQRTPYKDIFLNNPMVDSKTLANKKFITKLDKDSQLGMSSIINSQNVIALFNKIDPTGTKQSHQNIYDTLFDNYNGSAVVKGDIPYLMSDDLRKNTNLSNMNKIQWRYDASGDAYYAFDETGKNVYANTRTAILKNTPNTVGYKAMKAIQFGEDVATHSAEKRILREVLGE